MGEVLPIFFIFLVFSFSLFIFNFSLMKSIGLIVYTFYEDRPTLNEMSGCVHWYFMVLWFQMSMYVTSSPSFISSLLTFFFLYPLFFFFSSSRYLSFFFFDTE